MKLKKQGFTLVELMIAAAILMVVILGVVRFFVYLSVLADLSGTKTVAISEAQSKIDEIRNYDFNSIVADFDDTAFDSEVLLGKIFVDIDDTNVDLLGIRVVVCWSSKYGRVIGEDANLDGTFDAGTEDINNNGVINSIVEIQSMVARR